MLTSTRKMLLGIVLIAIGLGLAVKLVEFATPLSPERAIEAARQYVVREIPGVSVDDYKISASRYDWFDEWSVVFQHKSKSERIEVSVLGGDLYNGFNIHVY